MDLRRGWIAAAALAGIAVGVLAALAFGGSRAPGPGGAPVAASAGTDGLAAQLASLRAELQQEREASRLLAQELAQLRDEVEARLPAPAPGAEAESTEEPAEPAAPTSRAWFDDRALRELDTRPAEIDELREAYEQSQLDILYLRDRATREGWVMQPRFQKELQEREAELRQQLGDDRYDLLLYATRRPNRVVVQGVFANSPAERAGLRSGDTVLRYGDEPVFSPRDLREATTRGRAGETIPVDVLRDQRIQRFYLPRGPLGAHLRAERRPPGSE